MVRPPADGVESRQPQTNPALQTTRRQPAGIFDTWRGAVRQEDDSGCNAPSLRVQIAFAIVLLVDVSLLVRSFVTLRQISPGFDPDDVLVFRRRPPISIPLRSLSTRVQPWLVPCTVVTRR